MAVIEYDEYKQKLLALEPALGELEKALGIPKAREEYAELQKETEQDGFWNDLARSQKVSQQIKRLENRIKKHDRLVSDWEDAVVLCEMAQEEDDASLLPDVITSFETLEKEMEERRLAALLSGLGFAAAKLRGSQHNDPFRVEGGKVVTATNRCGGILGGITTGMPIVLRAAFKPTPSIAMEQETVDLRTMENTTLTVRGRHDPCIVHRAVPCVEAAVAIAVYDALLQRKKEL